MNDFVVAALFLIMVLSPCLVALQTGVHELQEEPEELVVHAGPLSSGR